jgi:hypothetical protein
LGSVCWETETRYLFNTSIYASILFCYALLITLNLFFERLGDKKIL